MINRFPTDRVNNFSDAIFAIAITLLILEVKIPPQEDIASLGLMGAFEKLIPSFISLLISFFVTALYWRAHLMNAQFIKQYDNRQLWLNIWLLLFVVLLPFSTALYSKNFNNNAAFIFYAGNLSLIGIFNYALIRDILQKNSDHELLTPLTKRWLSFRASVAPIIWALSALIALVFPLTARIIFISIFIILGFGDRRFRKRKTAAS